MDKTLQSTFRIMIAIAILLAFSQCGKRKDIEIVSVKDSVLNCSLPYEVHFYSEISPNTSNVTKHVDYTWDFGDGHVSHDDNPVHLYETPGSYMVILTIKNKKHEDTYSYPINLPEDPTPYADFEYFVIADSYYAPCEVVFTNRSIFATEYLWDFGDQTGSKDRNPTHVYETEGEKEIKLHAICPADGDTTVATGIIKVLPPPEEIKIEEVTVWMPENYTHLDLYCEVTYNGLGNERSSTIYDVYSFPATFSIRDELFFFDGDYETGVIEFSVWDVYNNAAPVYTFKVYTSWLQDEYYPTVVTVDTNADFGAEVILSYPLSSK